MSLPTCTMPRIAGAFLVLVCVLLSPAAAARMPLASSSLHAQSYDVGAVSNTFTYPTGTSLAATTDTCGNPWTIRGGTFTVTAAGTASASTDSLVTATVPLCNSTSVNQEAGGNIQPRGASSFGMLIHAAPGGYPATAAVYTNAGAGTLRLQRISSTGALTTLATVTGAGGGNAPRFLRLVYVDGVYTIAVNNADVLTYPVPDAATRSAYEANNHVGIVSNFDTRSSFDNFQAYPR